MGNCKDCQHWDAVDDIPETVEDYDNEERFKTGCRAVAHGNGEWTANWNARHNLAVAHDCDNYGARLVTHGNFGCVLFEKRKV